MTALLKKEREDGVEIGAEVETDDAVSRAVDDVVVAIRMFVHQSQTECRNGPVVVVVVVDDGETKSPVVGRWSINF